MTRQTFDSVWDAICDTPEEAAAMGLRSNLMTTIKDEVRSWKVTQREAARLLGITQPRLNDLLKGKISKFSLDALVSLATHANLNVEVNARRATLKADVRSTGHRARAPSAVPRKAVAAVKTGAAQKKG